MSSTRRKIQFEHKGIGETLYSDRLKVPLNQREYSWEYEHVIDLFTDLAKAISEDKTHFLGTIVLTNGGDEIPEITDGQQRLATTTILLAAIRDWFHREGYIEQANSIENDFLRKFDRRENTWVPRLQLNIDDNDFFGRYILPKPEDPERRGAAPTKASHKLIKQAADMAADRVREIVSIYSGNARRDELNKWVDFIYRDALVIVIHAPEDGDAFVMFETLNDRGLKTSQADLLKNYLLSQAKTDRIVEAQQKWARMTGTLESIGQGDITVQYLHHLLITQHGPTRAAEIFDKVKATVSGQAQTLRFLTDGAESANDYAALFNSDHPKWNEYGSTTRKHISTINRDLRVQQIRPLMFAVARHFSVKEAQKAFQLFVFWSVRFLVYGGRGGLLDRNYAIVAELVGSKKVRTASDLTDKLIDIIPTDAEFETAFREARVSAAFLARYYLRSLEKKSKRQPEPEWVPSDEESAINLEHILPENPNKDEWKGITTETAKAYYRRIGNMVLMKAKSNSTIGNASFDKKKDALRSSAFRLTQIAAAYDTWGADQIEARQEHLAELAVETWPIRIK